MLKSYLKLTLKVWMRRKFTTSISLFGIAFTLVVLMTATAVFDHALRPTGPEKDSERFLYVDRLTLLTPDRAGHMGAGPGYGFLDRYVRDMETPERISFYADNSTGLTYLNGVKLQPEIKRTDANFWRILDFEFIEGEPYNDTDVERGNFVIVMNQTTKRKFFHEQSALGKEITIDAQTFRVAGVVEDVSRLNTSAYADMWAPISTVKSTYEQIGNFRALLLAKSKKDIPLIKEEYATVLENMTFMDPRIFNHAVGAADTKLESLAKVMLGLTAADLTGTETSEVAKSVRKVRTFLAATIGVIILFMFLPAINLTNINISRIMERSAEIGIRKAFGASARTLIGQFIVENVLLTAVGGVIGLVGSILTLKLVSYSGRLPYTEFEMNFRIFGYGLLLVLIFGVMSGAYPAWKMSRLHPAEALNGRK